jgi:hypothetical protein
MICKCNIKVLAHRGGREGNIGGAGEFLESRWVVKILINIDKILININKY